MKREPKRREPKPILQVALLQTNPVWGEAGVNCAAAARWLRSLTAGKSADGRPDLVVLPEMFATGFALPPQQALRSSEAVLSAMRAMAAESGAVVAGTAATRDGAGRAVNRLWWVWPDGSATFYDKRHLFGLGDEKRDYAPGAPHEPVELAGWRVLPNICYDLRFPDYCRNRLVCPAPDVSEVSTTPAAPSDSAAPVSRIAAVPDARDYAYDLALFPASWPTARIAHWELLLQARAVENMAYTVGVNRVGEDANGLAHGGRSMAVSPKGRVLWCGGDRTEDAVCVALDWEALALYRQRFPVAADWPA